MSVSEHSDRAHRTPAGGVALALIAPLLLLFTASFAVPVMMMLSRGVTDTELQQTWPRTAELLKHWNGQGRPDSALVRTLATEMLASHRTGTLSLVANRLNYDVAGSRSLIYSTAAHLESGATVRDLDDLAALDTRWREAAIWSTLRHAAGPTTSLYLLAALDRKLDSEDRIVSVPSEQSVFIRVFMRTLQISTVVTLLCIALGYPVAHALASLPAKYANLMLILVLLPFWTSTLVRTCAWVALLQTHGLVNNFLAALGFIEEPLKLLYNRAGVYIAMTHVLLPYFILPLYGVMKTLSPDTLRAASSLGAPPLTAFLNIYLPQTFPGVLAGAVIVFTLALGYYVTPALVGGGGDQMISASIAFYAHQSLNWGMAAALSLLLLLPLALIGLARQSLLRAAS